MNMMRRLKRIASVDWVHKYMLHSGLYESKEESAKRQDVLQRLGQDIS